MVDDPVTAHTEMTVHVCFSSGTCLHLRTAVGLRCCVPDLLLYGFANVWQKPAKTRLYGHRVFTNLTPRVEKF